MRVEPVGSRLRAAAYAFTGGAAVVVALVCVLVAAAASAQGDAAQGQSLFKARGCANCHSINGSPGAGPTPKGVAGSRVQLTSGTTVTATDAYLIRSIEQPDAQIVKGFQKGIMSGVVKPGSISKTDAQSLAAYIDTLGGAATPSATPSAGPAHTGSPSASPSASPSGAGLSPSPASTLSPSASPAPSPSPTTPANGAALFAANCAGCHGPSGGGGDGPRLAAAAFAYIVAPMVRQGAPQAMPAFAGKLTDAEITAVAEYVATKLSDPAARTAKTSDGGVLYRLYCAGCHSSTGRGGSLAGGQNAPWFQGIPAARAWAAMLRGPSNMPIFAGSAFDVRQQAAVGRYVDVLTAPPSPGGDGLGWVGPVAEGCVAMLAVVGLVLGGVWLAWRKGGSTE